VWQVALYVLLEPTHLLERHRALHAALVSTHLLEPQFARSAQLALVLNTKQALVLSRLTQSAKNARLAQETSTSPLNALLMQMQSAVRVKRAQRQSTESLPAQESQTRSAALALHAQRMSISRQLAVRHQIQFVLLVPPALLDNTSKPLVVLLLIRFARRVRHATVQHNTKPLLALLQRILSALIEILMARLHVLLGPTMILPSLDVFSVLMVKHLQQALKVPLSVQLAPLAHPLALKEEHRHQLVLVVPQAPTQKQVLHLAQSVLWVNTLLLDHPRAQSAPLANSRTQQALQLVLIVLQASTRQ